MFELNTGIKIISMARRLQVTESLSTCIARKATHTQICAQIASVSLDLPSGFSSTASTEHSLLTCHHQEYHVLRNSMDPLHQDRKSLGVPIDLSQPPPAHQLSINVELTVLRYRAMHQTPRAVRLNCACV